MTDTNTPVALLAALGLARRHGSAERVLAAEGIELPEAERFEGLATDLQQALGRPVSDDGFGEALALGYIAGRVAHRPRKRTLQDPTAFVMNEELVVQGAEGESILRLPWFDDELFVGRQLPDISEMPVPVRTMCIDNYRAALAGERGQFTFVSYGHAYTVDAVPVRRANGNVEAVLAVATPGRSHAAAAAAHERTVERLDRCADLAEQRAEGHLRAGRTEEHARAQEEAAKARRAAQRSRASASRLRSHDATPADIPSISPREAEVLGLSSHGLNRAEIAEALALSQATVRTHLENAYSKLGVSDKAAAVAAALRHGLIE